MNSKELTIRYENLGSTCKASEKVAEYFLKEYKKELIGMTDEQIVETYSHYVYQIFFC